MMYAKLLTCRLWLLHSSSLINAAYHSYIQITFFHLLSKLCTLQSSYHPSIAEVLRCYHCLFLHFLCYARVRCNSTSLVAVCTKLVAQRGCLRWPCTSTAPNYSKHYSSSFRLAKCPIVCLVIRLCKVMVWQRRHSAALQMCIGTAAAQCSALQYSMPSLPQLACTPLRKEKYNPNIWANTRQQKSIFEAAKTVAHCICTPARLMWGCLQYAWICRSPACTLHPRSLICLMVHSLGVQLVCWTNSRYLASMVVLSWVPSN